jgi:hypothetical protein
MRFRHSIFASENRSELRTSVWRPLGLSCGFYRHSVMKFSKCLWKPHAIKRNPHLVWTRLYWGKKQKSISKQSSAESSAKDHPPGIKRILFTKTSGEGKQKRKRSWWTRTIYVALLHVVGEKFRLISIVSHFAGEVWQSWLYPAAILITRCRVDAPACWSSSAKG